MTIEDYLNLITAAFRDQPNFTDMISADVETQVQVQDLMLSMIPIFDVDTAIGDQLDIIGEWVGFPRTLSVPVEGVFFSWDGTDPTLGWDSGIWQTNEDQTQITVLPDDVYRNFIKAKIAANHWDGTTDGAYQVWDAAFPTISMLIIDDLDMSYRVAFVGGIIDALTIAVISGGFLPLKPEGVRISEYIFPSNTGPMFGWDLQTDFINGWDIGSWPQSF